MSDLVIWLALAGGEVLLVLLLLLSVSWFRHRAQRVRDLKGVEALVAWVQKGRVEREVSIRSFLADNYSLDDSALDAKTIPIVREEMRLYQTFANLYLRRDAVGVAGLGLAVEAAAAPYWTLQGGSVGGSTDPANPVEPEVTLETPVDDGELNRLRSENEQLQTELQITMHTISRMLNDYSAMFTGDSAELAPDAAGASVIDEGAAAVDDDAASAEQDASLEEVNDLAEEDAWTEDLDESLAAASTDETVVASDDAAPIVDELDDPVGQTPEAGESPILDINQALSDVSSDGDDEINTTADNLSEEMLVDLDAESEIANLLAETEDAMDSLEAVALRIEAGSNADEPVSKTAADELLADALGDADLALDDLDDLFDGIAMDEPADAPSKDDSDDEESVAI